VHELKERIVGALIAKSRKKKIQRSRVLKKKSTQAEKEGALLVNSRKKET
jgi:hypothetical protein